MTSPVSERVRKAVEARETLGEDFFGGWQPSDIELFQRHARPSQPTANMITDFLGIKIAARFHPWAAYMSGSVNADIPLPNDSLHAEAIEYFAFLHSIECAPQDSFTIVELGSSYGPWICAGATVARRTGRTKVRLTAVEASRLLFDLIPIHLAENGIATDNFDIRLIHGAVAPRPGKLYFPKVQTPGDLGGQATNRASDTDYRGVRIEHEEVTAYTLPDVLPEGATDLLHVDVQGTEAGLLQANIDFLNERVRAVFAGVHARRIEGELLELFHANRWSLIRERPTKFVCHPDRADIVGWTTRDGGQYWRNPRLPV
jgi:FkbM family methyltransferase